MKLVKLTKLVMPDRLMVGHQVLVLGILVRIQVRQPRKIRSLARELIAWRATKIIVYYTFFIIQERILRVSRDNYEVIILRDHLI